MSGVGGGGGARVGEESGKRAWGQPHHGGHEWKGSGLYPKSFILEAEVFQLYSWISPFASDRSEHVAGGGEVEWTRLPEWLCFALFYRRGFQKTLIKKESTFCC